MSLDINYYNEEPVVKLPQDIKDKWIEALRSGRYQQGQGCLRTDKDQYCCLGVLCDIINPGRWELSKTHPTRYHWDQAHSILPKKIQEMLGVNDMVRINSFEFKKPGTDVPFTLTSLTEVNDIGSYNFDQIASIIEEQL